MYATASTETRATYPAHLTHLAYLTERQWRFGGVTIHFVSHVGSTTVTPSPALAWTTWS